MTVRAIEAVARPRFAGSAGVSPALPKAGRMDGMDFMDAISSMPSMGGHRWAVESTGFATAVTEHLALVEQGGKTTVFAFTHGRGARRVAVDPQS